MRRGLCEGKIENTEMTNRSTDPTAILRRGKKARAPPPTVSIDDVGYYTMGTTWKPDASGAAGPQLGKFPTMKLLKFIFESIVDVSSRVFDVVVGSRQKSAVAF